MKYVHTNIITRDWKRLVAFYLAVFHCRIKPPVRNQSGEWLEKGTGVVNAHLEGAHLILPGYGDDGPTLEIYAYKEMVELENCSPNQRGYGHLAFEVEDVSEVLDKTILHGGSKQGKIVSRDVPEVGKITFVYVRDPDGNLVELQHWDYIDK